MNDYADRIIAAATPGYTPTPVELDRIWDHLFRAGHGWVPPEMRDKLAETEAVTERVRKEFEGAVTEIGANKTLAARDDDNRGWNDASDHAIRFIRRYIAGKGLFQL